MMKNLALLLIPVFILTGCKKDEEESADALILDFSIVNTSITDFSLEEIIIEEDFSQVVVLAENNLSGENPPISEFNVPQF